MQLSLTVGLNSLSCWAGGVFEAEVVHGVVALHADALPVVRRSTGALLLLNLRAGIVAHQTLLQVVRELRIMALTAFQALGGRVFRAVSAHELAGRTLVACDVLTRLCIPPEVRGICALTGAWPGQEYSCQAERDVPLQEEE